VDIGFDPPRYLKKGDVVAVTIEPSTPSGDLNDSWPH
jgi:hypothetical protein